MAELTRPTPTQYSVLRRGPMYSAYAELREWKLRTKKFKSSPPLPIPVPTKRARPQPMVSRSVQDFSMAFRKENKRPPVMTPPPPMAPKVEVRKAGSASVNRGASSMRKSYSCLKELKAFATVAATAIDEEGRGGGKGGVMRKSVGSFRMETSTRTTRRTLMG